jgi:hypothetical protein
VAFLVPEEDIMRDDNDGHQTHPADQPPKPQCDPHPDHPRIGNPVVPGSDRPELDSSRAPQAGPATSSHPRRANLREHGEPLRGVYFGRRPQRPTGDGVLVTIAREARAVRLRDAAGDTVAAFGDTTKFWLSAAPTDPGHATAPTAAANVVAAAGVTRAPRTTPVDATQAATARPDAITAAATAQHTLRETAFTTSRRRTRHLVGLRRYDERGAAARLARIDRHDRHTCARGARERRAAKDPALTGAWDPSSRLRSR